jgi:hypothetical protein
VAAFKDLCLDAADPFVVGTFWAQALAGRLEARDAGDTAVRPGAAAFPLHTLWVDRVPEPKTGKNRVHLDVYGRTEDLLQLGATVLADHGRWQVLGDPEGNEFCVFPRPDTVTPIDAPAHVFGICVDSATPVELAAWWHARLGGELGPGPDGRLRWLRGAVGLGAVVLKAVQVDDPRLVKNRCHWDVTGSVLEFTDTGALVLGPGRAWSVLADPEGNEFCVFSG